MTASLTRPDRGCAPNFTSYEQARRDLHPDVPERWNPVLGIVEAWAAEDQAASRW